MEFHALQSIANLEMIRLTSPNFTSILRWLAWVHPKRQRLRVNPEKGTPAIEG